MYAGTGIPLSAEKGVMSNNRVGKATYGLPQKAFKCLHLLLFSAVNRRPMSFRIVTVYVD
jgi:hypothetical protein